MAGIKGYTRGNRCPICGKPDWCGWYVDDNGLTRIIEKRAEYGAACTNPGDTVAGADGEVYYFFKNSRDGGNKIFLSRMDWERSQEIRQEEYEQWCKDHGKKAKKDKYVSVPLANSSVVTAPKPAPKKEPVEINKVEPLDNATLDKVFRKMANLLILEDRHRYYLRNEGWTDEMIEHFKVRSFPERDKDRLMNRPRESKNIWRKKLAQKIMDETGLKHLRGVPGAYQTSEGAWTFHGPGGIIFFLPDVSGHLYRGRIRMDFRDVPGQILKDQYGEYFTRDGERIYLSMKGQFRMKNGTKEYLKGGGKYRNLSSFQENDKALKEGRIENIYSNGCRSGNSLGFYFGPSHKAQVVYVTEGEKKAAYASWEMDNLVISVPGVDSWPLLFKKDESSGLTPVQQLAKMGTKAFIVAFDADKGTNASVLARESQTAKALNDAGFMIGIANWDIKDGKGLDDLLASGLQPRYSVWK